MRIVMLILFFAHAKYAVPEKLDSVKLSNVDIINNSTSNITLASKNNQTNNVDVTKDANIPPKNMFHLLQKGPISGRGIVDIQKAGTRSVSYIIHPDNLPPPKYTPLRVSQAAPSKSQNWDPMKFLRKCCSDSNLRDRGIKNGSTSIIQAVMRIPDSSVVDKNNSTELPIGVDFSNSSEPVTDQFLHVLKTNEDYPISESLKMNATSILLDVLNDNISNDGLSNSPKRKVPQSSTSNVLFQTVNPVTDSTTHENEPDISKSFIHDTLKGEENGEVEPKLNLTTFSVLQRNDKNIELSSSVNLSNSNDINYKEIADEKDKSYHILDNAKANSSNVFSAKNSSRIEESSLFEGNFLGSLLRNIGNLDPRTIRQFYSIFLHHVLPNKDSGYQEQQSAALLRTESDRKKLEASIIPSSLLSLNNARHSGENWRPFMKKSRNKVKRKFDHRQSVVTVPSLDSYEVPLGSVLNAEEVENRRRKAQIPFQRRVGSPNLNLEQSAENNYRVQFNVPPAEALSALPEGSVLIPASQVYGSHVVPQLPSDQSHHLVRSKESERFSENSSSNENAFDLRINNLPSFLTSIFRRRNKSTRQRRPINTRRRYYKFDTDFHLPMRPPPPPVVNKHPPSFKRHPSAIRNRVAVAHQDSNVQRLDNYPYAPQEEEQSHFNQNVRSRYNDPQNVNEVIADSINVESSTRRISYPEIYGTSDNNNPYESNPSKVELNPEETNPFLRRDNSHGLRYYTPRYNENGESFKRPLREEFSSNINKSKTNYDVTEAHSDGASNNDYQVSKNSSDRLLENSPTLRKYLESDFPKENSHESRYYVVKVEQSTKQRGGNIDERGTTKQRGTTEQDDETDLYHHHSSYESDTGIYINRDSANKYAVQSTSDEDTYKPNDYQDSDYYYGSDYYNLQDTVNPASETYEAAPIDRKDDYIFDYEDFYTDNDHSIDDQKYNSQDNRTENKSETSNLENVLQNYSYEISRVPISLNTLLNSRPNIVLSSNIGPIDIPEGTIIPEEDFKKALNEKKYQNKFSRPSIIESSEELIKMLDDDQVLHYASMFPTVSQEQEHIPSSDLWDNEREQLTPIDRKDDEILSPRSNSNLTSIDDDFSPYINFTHHSNSIETEKELLERRNLMAYTLIGICIGLAFISIAAVFAFTRLRKSYSKDIGGKSYLRRSSVKPNDQVDLERSGHKLGSWFSGRNEKFGSGKLRSNMTLPDVKQKNGKSVSTRDLLSLSPSTSQSSTPRHSQRSNYSTKSEPSFHKTSDGDDSNAERLISIPGDSEDPCSTSWFSREHSRASERHHRSFRKSSRERSFHDKSKKYPKQLRESRHSVNYKKDFPSLASVDKNVTQPTTWNSRYRTESEYEHHPQCSKGKGNNDSDGIDEPQHSRDNDSQSQPMSSSEELGDNISRDLKVFQFGHNQPTKIHSSSSPPYKTRRNSPTRREQDEQKEIFQEFDNILSQHSPKTTSFTSADLPLKESRSKKTLHDVMVHPPPIPPKPARFSPHSSASMKKGRLRARTPPIGEESDIASNDDL